MGILAEFDLSRLHVSLAAGIEGIVLAVVLFVVANVAMLVLIVRLPADYFSGPQRPGPLAQRHPALRWAGAIARNLAGVLLVILGVVMSLPGIPGPGIVVLLIGVSLVNFPGKRRLEQKLVSYPRVHSPLDKLRARFGRPPFILESPTQAKDSDN